MALHWTIYCHTHIETGRRYIGLTKLTMMKRWNQHVYNARIKSGRGCEFFWNAIRKHGKDAFSHEVLEVCMDLEMANLAEDCWVEFYDTRDPEKGFNLAKGGKHVPHPVKNPWDRPGYREKAMAASRAGLNTPESRARRSAASKKLWADPNNREKLSESLKAQAATPEGHAQRVAASKPGKVLSPEHREKIQASSRSSDPGVRARVSAGVRAAFADPEVKERVFSALVGRKLSPEHVAKIVASNTGRSLSQETRDRISATIRSAPRRSHCKRGHSMDDAVIGSDGKRRCKTCMVMRNASHSLQSAGTA